MANIIIPLQHQSAPKTLYVPPGTDPREMPAFVPRKPEDDAPGRVHSDGLMHRDMDMDDLQAEGTPYVVKEKGNNHNVEALLAEHEKNMNDERTKAQRWAGQERWQGRENEEMRLVNILHPHTFIERLQRAGVAASTQDPYDWFRDHHVDIAFWPVPSFQLWLNSFSAAGLVGITAKIKGEIKTVTSLQYPLGPEYSIMRFNEMNVPTKERYRGWRTALLELIMKEVITEEQATRAFGPATGPASLFYNEQLQQHRSLRLGIKTQ